MRRFNTFIRDNAHILLTALIVLIAVIVYGGYRYYLLSKDYSEVSRQAQTFQSSLLDEQAQNTTLNAELGTEKETNSTFQTQISDISGTVSTLDKLSKTDPQLLQKYSKVYFLNENYIPSSLSYIDTQYLYDSTIPLQIHTSVKPFLEKMFDQASASGVPMQVISAYRSFGTQAMLKSSYTVDYGAGTANSFSADQGYSEHQLGTAVDLTTSVIGSTFDGFDKTTAYTWLTNNAYQYGFILSYPPNNSYYIFEPWHWRFVGIALATTLHADNEYFYQMDQREINTYLVNIFNN